MTVNLQQLARTLKEVSPAYVKMAVGLIAQVTLNPQYCHYIKQ